MGHAKQGVARPSISPIFSTHSCTLISHQSPSSDLLSSDYLYCSLGGNNHPTRLWGRFGQILFRYRMIGRPGCLLILVQMSETRAMNRRCYRCIVVSRQGAAFAVWNINFPCTDLTCAFGSSVRLKWGLYLPKRCTVIHKKEKARDRYSP